jgi:para-aminobenzoate synthetase component 1
MTRRYQAPYRGDLRELYIRLRQKNPAPFSAFLETGDLTILSSSPERFFEVRGDIIRTRPIKGTAPRGKTYEEDERNKNNLLESEKDKAELLMIVDLERNDLGRIAEIGSVKVSELFALETYETVFHLVATVEAKLNRGNNLETLLRAMFPGGSITGAPKIRAMEIIEELEPTRRNIYTGSIGYLDFNGNIDLNIAIRTLIAKDDFISYQVGGGIVWDSEEELEYQETLHKGKALMEVLMNE